LLRLDPEQTEIAPSAFIANNATVIGDVHIGEHASIWFQTVIRGDTESVRIGHRVNVQDLTMVHADPGFPCVLEDGVTIGHRAIIHGAHIGKGSMIGMGAIVMNGARIGEHCLVGAGALITQGSNIPPRSLVLGSPARVKRPLTDAELAMISTSTEHYAHAGSTYKERGFGRPNGES